MHGLEQRHHAGRAVAAAAGVRAERLAGAQAAGGGAGGGGVAAAAGEHALAGAPGAAAVVALMDGTRSLDEICCQLSLPAAEVMRLALSEGGEVIDVHK